MDWNEVGAIFTIGCFVLAGLTLLATVSPFPWRRKQGEEVSPLHSAHRNHWIVVTLVLGFLAASVTTWFALHPRQPFDSTGHFVVVRDRVFINEKVVVDGKDFIDCTFRQVTFVYNGTAYFSMSHSNIIRPIQVETSSDPVTGTIIFLRAIGYLNSSVPLTYGEEHTPLKKIQPPIQQQGPSVAPPVKEQ
jgi:hypothetical protein